MSFIIGADTSATSTTALHSLGSLTQTDDGKIYEYVQADGTGCSAGDCVIISEAGVIDQATTTSSAPAAGQGLAAAVAEIAFAASAYGWVLVKGATAALNVGSSCAVHTNLNTTASAGRLDDDATAGAEVIDGITTTGAESGNSATAYVHYPKVGRTL